jgi:hypothetical protein
VIAVAPLWRERYEAERAHYGGYPEAFLHSLCHLLVGMELDGVFTDSHQASACWSLRSMPIPIQAPSADEEGSAP